MDPKIKAFLNLVAYSEGTSTHKHTQKDGHDVIVSGIDGWHTFEDFSQHPFASGRPAIQVTHAGLRSTAAGSYQILIGAWREIAAKLGLKDFSPESQDLAG